MGRLAAGDSSPPSAESNFRELDEVFLQNQTRMWIGEILKTRLNEDLHICDLLQDGEILFEVSQVVWNLLLSKRMELRHLKHKYGLFGSKKSSGRYRPYSNVDSFIKICKILGLSGVDLFSPSDVVEKRDTRKVCICIRAFSKKIRSKQLTVPDFDLVMHSVAMPTDMVGGIRRSLESSQCTSSSSYSSSYKGSQMKQKQKKMHALSGRDDESSSDDSDEAESRYMSGCSFSSSSKFDDDDTCINSGQEDLLEADSKHVGHNNNMAFPGNKDSVEGDSSSRVNVVGSNYISDYLAFSDLMVHKADGNSSVIGENSMFDFFLNGDSQGLTSSSFQNDDDEDMEVSSTTSLSSVFGRMLSFEFDDPFDVADESSSTTNGYSSESIIEHEAEKQHCKDDSCCRAHLSNPEYEFFCQNADEFVEEDNNNEIPPLLEDSEDNDETTLVVSDYSDSYVSTIEANEHENASEIHPYLPVKEMKVDDHAAYDIQDEIISSGAENGCQVKKQNEKAKPLLKTVVKGTAIAGILFLLVHVRKSRGNNNAQETKKDTPMYKESKFTLTGSRGKGVYPVEKFKF